MVSRGATCIGRVAKISPSCHGCGWERDTSKQGAVEWVEACKRKKKQGDEVFSKQRLARKEKQGDKVFNRQRFLGEGEGGGSNKKGNDFVKLGETTKSSA